MHHDLNHDTMTFHIHTSSVLRDPDWKLAVSLSIEKRCSARRSHAVVSLDILSEPNFTEEKKSRGIGERQAEIESDGYRASLLHRFHPSMKSSCIWHFSLTLQAKQSQSTECHTWKYYTVPSQNFRYPTSRSPTMGCPKPYALHRLRYCFLPAFTSFSPLWVIYDKNSSARNDAFERR